ncbi:hypothetical protein ACWDUL_38350 [Nocardia niigatensis]
MAIGTVVAECDQPVGPESLCDRDVKVRSATGRFPRYCGETVDGVTHNDQSVKTARRLYPKAAQMADERNAARKAAKKGVTVAPAPSAEARTVGIEAAGPVGGETTAEGVENPAVVAEPRQDRVAPPKPAPTQPDSTMVVLDGVGGGAMVEGLQRELQRLPELLLATSTAVDEVRDYVRGIHEMYVERLTRLEKQVAEAVSARDQAEQGRVEAERLAAAAEAEQKRAEGAVTALEKQLKGVIAELAKASSGVAKPSVRAAGGRRTRPRLTKNQEMMLDALRAGDRVATVVRDTTATQGVRWCLDGVRAAERSKTLESLKELGLLGLGDFDEHGVAPVYLTEDGEPGPEGKDTAVAGDTASAGSSGRRGVQLTEHVVEDWRRRVEAGHVTRHAVVEQDGVKLLWHTGNDWATRPGGEALDTLEAQGRIRVVGEPLPERPMRVEWVDAAGQ